MDSFEGYTSKGDPEATNGKAQLCSTSELETTTITVNAPAFGREIKVPFVYSYYSDGIYT